MEAGYGLLGHDKPKPSMADKKHPARKHGIKHTHIEHHADGSHNFTHTMQDGSEVGHAAADDQGMQDHMAEMMQGGGAAPDPAGAPALAPPAAAVAA
jgi:hypothetical protein